MKRCLLLVLVGVCCTAALPLDISPARVVKLVGDAVTAITATEGCDDGADKSVPCSFGKWAYGPAIIMSELLRSSRNVEIGVDYRAFADARLDYWLRTPNSTAWNLTKSVPMPWGYSIGDRVGLYPITYLERGTDGDVALALAAAKLYLLPWPRRWTDGTVARDTGDNWPGEQDDPGHASFIWGDDAFMGLTLLARLAAAGAGSPADRAAFRAAAGAQHAHYVAHLASSAASREDGLYFHGQNAADGHTSCWYD
eukprot:g1954.t1